jgi:mono/diheme cytochrome c family protein
MSIQKTSASNERCSWRAAAILGALMCAAQVRGAGAAPDAAALFEKEVRPLLVEKCQRCHGPKKQQAGLRLDSRAGLMKGGDSGPAIVLTAPEKSRLLAVLWQQGDVKMPPKGKLRDEQIAALAMWVQMGAPWPDDARASTPLRGGPITVDERRFWSLQAVTDPPVPKVPDDTWALTTVDRFVLAKLEAEELMPNRTADRRTLVRRVTFDLTGLPPTIEEIEDFLSDQSPDAFERVVDRLLASRHYGERWGRHWLDVVRYADTAGDGADYPVREAYKYRDYVIDAFNADKPYDEFLREQIAGDILARRGPAEKYAERVIATGYLAVGKRFGYNLSTEFQHLDFAEVIDTVGRSVLGLSLGCARCHDHKFDPVNMTDYYALYGILQSSKWSFPGGEEYKRPANLLPLVVPEEAARREKARAVELAPLDVEEARLKTERAAATAKPADKPPSAELKARLAKLDAALAQLAQRRAEIASREIYQVAYGVSEGTPTQVRIQKRGEPDTPGPEVPRRFLEVLGGDPLPAGTGSGRLELAEWLTRPSNPLTARVFVNRVWQWHFGRGLVATPSDFGTRGDPPSHPDLLDHLATAFVRSGYSVKGLHRLILRSRVYQLSSEDNAKNHHADPHDRWLWRHTRRPLDAESIRDAMLTVSGRLDRSTPAGHPFPPVTGWAFTIHNPFYAVYDSNHRSVYLMVQRARRHPYLALFDAADPNISTAERLPTTTPTQALFLMNAPFVHEQAGAFARRLLATPGADAAHVRLAFAMAHGRPASQDEVRDTLAFLDGYRRKLAAAGTPADDAPVGAWTALGRVLMTSNAFLFVD